MYTHLEDYVFNLYHNLSISHPEQLDIEEIASKLGINLYYSSSTYRYGNNIILQYDTKQKQWQLFGHEICHYLRHFGNQLTMKKSFKDLQEWQANHFAYHFCVPTFMLENIHTPTVTDIITIFNVEFDFALRRLEMYQSKLHLDGDSLCLGM
ncbi:ImmA/IrrE family metallo-endopeptidase [Ornithinibacillus sp. FSL M8-0202]|uniref:ImmA/IrrE family metallo-endopeptidase n=1 Tax=unclassified Ornithinibacillus TaxID=2620869 RepID=UPI0030CC0986